MSLGAARVKEPGRAVTDQVLVKEESEFTDEERLEAYFSSPSRGVSEAAQQAGMYTDHVVKDELVQHPPACGDSAGSRVSEAAGLYTNHVVKDELVLGPESVQRPHIAYIHDLSRSRREPCLSSPKCSAQLERFQPAETTSAEQEPIMRRGTTTGTLQHAADATYVCDSCGKQFTRKHCLILHLKAHLRQKHESSNKSTVNIHQSNHTTKSRYSCESKNESSKNEKTNTIISIFTGERPYACDICKKTFKRKGNLRQHEHIHTGEKPFSCEICKQKFRHSSTLKTHKRIHTGEKPYVCDICKKGFTNIGNLKTHHRTHTGEKPYACDICQNMFAKSSTLKFHKRIHTGERPYACDICEKRFTQLSNIQKHRRIHTGEKAHSC